MADGTIAGVEDAHHRYKNTVLITSIITAAVVSAATAGYIVWRKSQENRGSADSVQDLLDKAHRTLHLLEGRLGDLRDSVSLPSANDTSSTATA